MKIEAIGGGVNATLDSGVTIFLKWSEFWTLCREGIEIDTRDEVQEYLSQCDNSDYETFEDDIPDEIISEIVNKVIVYRINKESGDDIYEAASNVLRKLATPKGKPVGIGILTAAIRPYLNPQKCLALVREQLPDEEISEIGFDIENYLYGEPFENLGAVLWCCDDTETTTFGENEYGEDVFYCPLEWYAETVEDTKNILASAVEKLCDLSGDEICGFIKDIYENDVVISQIGEFYER